MTIFIRARLAQTEAQEAYTAIQKWFKENPDRKDCQTEDFVVRRDSVKEDILEHSVIGVELK
jgi:hypothetical protein